MLNLSQDVLRRRTFNEAIYKAHSEKFMLARTLPYIRTDRNVVDVGAAVGMYSTFWAPHCDHLYAYEPVPPIFGELTKLEDKFHNVTAINKAVSNFVGTSTFWVDDKRLSNNGFQNHVDGQPIAVQVTQLDDENLGDVGFLKVDCEGNELDVLLGAKALIQTCRPTCMVEIYPRFNDGDIDFTFGYFWGLNYRCYFNHRDLQTLVQIESTEHGVDVANDEQRYGHDYDFLFVPQ